MFFYVDESGNSGANLFDRDQPVLSYGVLSSRKNLDRLARERSSILAKLGPDGLHANKLKFDGLRPIAGDLIALQRKFDLRFDYRFVHKLTFAAIAFQSAVFDAGLNEAVPWIWYWTPLRFSVVGAIAKVMDEALLSESWDLCQLPRKRVEGQADRVVKLLEAVLERVRGDAEINDRLKEVVIDGLRYAIRFPGKMDFGIYDKKVLTPNAVGFQFVLTAIARRLKTTGRKALGITVDHQSEFNSIQVRTFDYHSGIAKVLNERPSERQYYLGHPSHEGAREDVEAMLSHFPDKAFVVSASDQSFGLQITDTFLWLTNRYIRDGRLPPELTPIASRIFRTGSMDGISLDGMAKRFQAFENRLPTEEEITPELRAAADAAREEHRSKVSGMDLD